jgi:hypothetical protein
VETDLGAPPARVAGIESGLEGGGRLESQGRECEGLETDGLQTSYMRCEVKNLKVVSVGSKLRRRLEHRLMYRAENQAIITVCVCVCARACMHAYTHACMRACVRACVRACKHARMYSVQIYVKICQFTVTACNINTGALTFCLF